MLSFLFSFANQCSRFFFFVQGKYLIGHFQLYGLMVQVQCLELDLLPFLTGYPFRKPLDQQAYRLFTDRQSQFAHLCFSGSVSYRSRYLIYVVRTFYVLIIHYRTLQTNLQRECSVGRCLNFSRHQIQFSGRSTPQPRSGTRQLITDFGQTYRRPGKSLGRSLYRQRITHAIRSGVGFKDNIKCGALVFFHPDVTRGKSLYGHGEISRKYLLRKYKFCGEGSEFIGSDYSFRDFTGV